MSETSNDLLAIAAQLEELRDRLVADPGFAQAKVLSTSAKHIGLAHSGSWTGYQAFVYYENFQSPPTGAHFSSEWGFSNRTVGSWKEYSLDDVNSAISTRAGVALPLSVDQAAEQVVQQYRELRGELDSVMTTLPVAESDDYIDGRRFELGQISLSDQGDLIAEIRAGLSLPDGTRDGRAGERGRVIPPHVSVFAYAETFARLETTLFLTFTLCRNIAKHLQRKERTHMTNRAVGKRIFIGHGRSSVWRDLKELLWERLHLEYDEFNRVSAAGIANGARIGQMLDEAQFAFIVMTAEDETAAGTMQARMNVVHEVGLFQGRLGWNRAIVLLEEGCEEFSNIQGLGQIRFPKGKIEAKFEEIRKVLEREHVV